MANNENERLLKIEVAADETASVKAPAYAVAQTFPDSDEEREWDGHLLQCCGKRDRHGFAAFASTLLCLPRTLGLNIRATGRSRWSKSLIIFTLIALVTGALWINQVSYAVHTCGPDGPRPHPHKHLPHHEPGAHGENADDLDKPEMVFLGGATLDPMYSSEPASLPVPKEDAPEEKPGFSVVVNGQEVGLNEFEATNEQVQLAKNEALEGMAQLSLGRKLLHKHHDDDDDDHEHDDKPKHGKKKCKHGKKDKKRDEDDDDEDKPAVKAETFDDRREIDPHHPKPHGPHHPRPEDEPITPECFSAKIALVSYELFFFLSLSIAMLSGYKLRMRMREQFNIKGSWNKDYCAWFFCMPCAVCQETRTLTKNNVEDGVWYGPTQLVRVNHPPAQQTMSDTPQKMIEV